MRGSWSKQSLVIEWMRKKNWSVAKIGSWTTWVSGCHFHSLRGRDFEERQVSGWRLCNWLFSCLLEVHMKHSGEHVKEAGAWGGVSQWIEHQPVSGKVAGLIPSQSTCPGCRPGPRLGVCKRQLIDVSLAHCYFSASLS